MFKNKIKISFVVPAYNSEKTIEQCLKGIRNIILTKEIIVIDDGSKDNTSFIAKKYADKIISIKHSGPARARNIGWLNTNFDIIMFVDSDVVINTSCIKEILKRLKKYDVLIFGDKSFELSLDINKFVPPQDITLIKKNVLKTIKGYSEIFPWPAGEDTDMLIKALKSGFRCKSLKCKYTHLGRHQKNKKLLLIRWISNFIMNLKNIDTRISKQWLLRKITGFIILKYLKKDNNSV